MNVCFAPETGGGGGGGNSSQTSGQPAGGQQTGQPAGQQQQQVDDPFAKIDIDSLDDASRAELEKAKAAFATLQTTAAQREREAREHQSRYDRTQAELNRIKHTVSGQTDPSQPQQPKTAEERAYVQLKAAGIPEVEAKAQAKVLGGILEAERAHIRTELGRDFAPVAGIALTNQAEGAFNAAQAVDVVGWTQIPEVKQLVWNSCVEMVQGGQPVDAMVVKNLAAMHFMAYAETNPQVFATLQNPSQPQPGSGTMTFVRPSVPRTVNPPNLSTGGFTFPGANHAPIFNQPPPVGGARSIMDPSTSAAMNAVNKEWEKLGLKPKG